MRPCPPPFRSPCAKGSELRGLSFLTQSALLPPPSLFLGGLLSSGPPTPSPAPPAYSSFSSAHPSIFCLHPPPRQCPSPASTLSPIDIPFPFSVSPINIPSPSSAPPPSISPPPLVPFPLISITFPPISAPLPSVPPPPPNPADLPLVSYLPPSSPPSAPPVLSHPSFWSPERGSMGPYTSAPSAVMGPPPLAEHFTPGPFLPRST